MENTGASPRFLARMVVVGYLLLLISGFDLFFVLPRLLVHGDAAATAAAIQAHQGLFLVGFASALLGVAAYLMITTLLYRLLEPVSRTVSLSAALFSLTGCIVQAVGVVFHYLPLLVLEDQPYLRAFQPEQRQALAMVFLRAYGQAYNISLVFFAFYLVQIGYLVLRSTFLPRWLGFVLLLGGGGLVFLYPPLAQALLPTIMLSSIGELLLMLWLGFKGVDERRWRARAAEARLPD